MKKMKIQNWILLVVMIPTVVFLTGCGSGGSVDESKPIQEVESEAQQMDVAQLRETGLAYKAAIQAKLEEIKPIKEQLKAIPLTEMLSDKAKQLQGEIDSINQSVKALEDRFRVYYSQLKELKGDLSGLNL